MPRKILYGDLQVRAAVTARPAYRRIDHSAHIYRPLAGLRRCGVIHLLLKLGELK